MNDIWSKVGSEFTPQGEDWLYQKGGQIHGPVPKESIVQKLLSGEMGVDTHVAREGGEFHPISQVATFAPHLEEVKKILGKRSSAKMRTALIGVFLILLAIGGLGAMYFQKEAQKNEKEGQEHAEKERQRLDEMNKKAKDVIAGDKVELVALVSFDEKEMTVGNTKPATSGGKKTNGTPKAPPKEQGGKAPPQEAPFVSECERDQGEIFDVLRKNLAKINFCVEDEKKRDAQNLLPAMLKLSFVATPSGKVTDFEILDRHYRIGPMKNCMLKSFQQIKFNPAGGSNCPVTIPIKIGG